MRTSMLYARQIVGLIALIAVAGILALAQLTLANIQGETPTQIATFQNYTFFATSTTQSLGYATSTTATSTNIAAWFDAAGRKDTGVFYIDGAKKATFYFSRTGNNGNQGSSRFQVQVTPDGTNWYYYAKWMENASTTSNFIATSPNITSFTLTSTSSAVITMNLTNDAFLAARVIVNETTDGEHSASATAEF